MSRKALSNISNQNNRDHNTNSMAQQVSMLVPSYSNLMGLSYGDESNDMQHDMFGSGHDLDLRSNFQPDLSRSFYISFDAA